MTRADYAAFMDRNADNDHPRGSPKRRKTGEDHERAVSIQSGVDDAFEEIDSNASVDATAQSRKLVPDDRPASQRLTPAQQHEQTVKAVDAEAVVTVEDSAEDEPMAEMPTTVEHVTTTTSAGGTPPSTATVPIHTAHSRAGSTNTSKRPRAQSPQGLGPPLGGVAQPSSLNRLPRANRRFRSRPT